MTYRDELAASQARAEALARELADTRAELARLKNPESHALVRAGGTALVRGEASKPAARAWLGAPSKLGYARELDGEVPETAYTELVECIRTAIGSVGSVTILPGSLAWASSAPSNGVGPFVNVYITIRGGKTAIHADDKLGNLAGAIFGGVGGGVGGGGIVLPILLAGGMPILVPVAISLWLGAVYAGCRALFHGSAASRASRLETLVDDLAAIAERAIADHRSRPAAGE